MSYSQLMEANEAFNRLIDLKNKQAEKDSADAISKAKTFRNVKGRRRR